MEDVTALMPREEAVRLLSFAAGTERASHEYENYIVSENLELYGFADGGGVVGCIGAAWIKPGELEIRHIAVAQSARGNGYGKAMIRALRKKLEPATMAAETDHEAVGFYRSIGFKTESLGEKYPGVERFWCRWENEQRQPKQACGQLS